MGSCKNEKSYSTIPLESMLLIDILVKPGDNIIPFKQDTFAFLGLPGAIGTFENNKELPFLVLGKNLDEESEFLCHFIGSIRIETEEKIRTFGIVIPVSDDYRTIDVNSYTDLATNHPSIKLWIQDYFRFALSDEVFKSVRWNNEIDVLRKLKTTND
jgi:hypothetical protein